jgi:hypothetical protein
MYEATGMPVGARPGGGLSLDYNPHDQMAKAFKAARLRRVFESVSWIDVWCPEIETYPRAFASRTAQGLLNEAFVNLAFGMNCLSLLIMDTRCETDEWYSENLLRPLAIERKYFEDYLRCNTGTLVAGCNDKTSVSFENLYRYALSGVPILPCMGSAFGEITDADIRLVNGEFPVAHLTSSAIMAMRREMDGRANGKTPIFVETPTIGLVVPRVMQDGKLKSVAFINARIDVQRNIKIRLRNISTEIKTAMWHEMRRDSKRLAIERLDNNEARVVIPEISAWNCGWLSL